MLKTQRQEEHTEMQQLESDLAKERARNSELEKALEASAAAQAEVQSLQQELARRHLRARRAGGGGRAPTRAGGGDGRLE